jgi:hypothetical protein
LNQREVEEEFTRVLAAVMMEEGKSLFVQPMALMMEAKEVGE